MRPRGRHGRSGRPAGSPTPPPRQARTFGYARISTPDQGTRLQVGALLAAGVVQEDIFVGQGSGATAARSGLDALRAEVAEGDAVVAWRLDRLCHLRVKPYIMHDQLVSETSVVRLPKLLAATSA